MEDLSRITCQNDTLSQSERCLAPHVAAPKEGVCVCRPMPCWPNHLNGLASQEERMAEPLACLLLLACGEICVEHVRYREVAAPSARHAYPVTALR